jgi:hypothetical protein
LYHECFNQGLAQHAQDPRLHPQYFKTNKQNQKAHQGLIVEHLKYTQGEATSTILPLSAEPVSLPSNAFGFLPELFFFVVLW